MESILRWAWDMCSRSHLCILITPYAYLLLHQVLYCNCLLVHILYYKPVKGREYLSSPWPLPSAWHITDTQYWIGKKQKNTEQNTNAYMKLGRKTGLPCHQHTKKVTWGTEIARGKYERRRRGWILRVNRDFPGGPVVKTPHPQSVQGYWVWFLVRELYLYSQIFI